MNLSKREEELTLVRIALASLTTSSSIIIIITMASIRNIVLLRDYLHSFFSRQLYLVNLRYQVYTQTYRRFCII